MEFEYEIKGITLSMSDMVQINEYYEAACTAEYLMDNYDITDKDEAIDLGYDVRRLMDKYGYDEQEAIYKVLGKNDDEDEDEVI